ncbi:MAG: phosphoenolpyruvate--protein phosphotransferase [Butyrivibrio sp.]|nr:phosphoenolpyruvate--protein phosphotransferase [Butyrivibrio sp.]
MYKGIAASGGIGIGNVCVIKEQELKYDAVIVNDAKAEKKRLDGALLTLRKITKEAAESVRSRIGSSEADILDGHVLMMSDPALIDPINKKIEEGLSAEAASEAVLDGFIKMFRDMDDELMSQRAADVKDIKTGLLKALIGVKEVDVEKVPQGTVLVVKELTLSVTSRINRENVVGIITEEGGITSHSLILARALEIPAVLAVKDITDLATDKDTVIVDGSRGHVLLNPDDETYYDYIAKREDYLRREELLSTYKDKKTVTADGFECKVCSNIGSPYEAARAFEHGSEGIGLFRSEFLFMENNHLPSEEEQFNAYKEAVTAMKGKPVVIRTMDIGGDKEIPYLNLKKESNPFLGFRGVRYSLGNKESFRTQLRAIMRAGEFGKVKIMVPFVTCLDELKEVRALVKEIAKELDAEKMQYGKDVEVGCMIETPSAALIADILAKEADFFSIGTNDLIQYTMSVDRGNGDVSYLYSALQPSVLRSIKNIIESGKKAGIPVAMCGEAASDSLILPLLISFGLEEYSVNPADVLRTRAAIAGWSKKDADELAEKVLSLDTEKEIIEVLEKANTK